MTVHQHLLDCAAEYHARHRSPSVAWDCIGAEAWAKVCETLAERVAGMPEEEALADLIRFRERDPDFGQNGPDAMRGHPASPFMVSLDFYSETHRIIDPISCENVGWIEVGAHGGLDDGKRSVRPGYRRMLGINQCAASIGRERVVTHHGCRTVRDETDADWLARSRAWLSRYHPEVKVYHREQQRNSSHDFLSEPFYGTVADFIQRDYLVVKRCTQPWIKKSA